jgi:secondary thiamine-phosphate synthase enzyme
MPQAPITQSVNYTIAFLLLFSICFFPGLPQYLLKLPLRPFLSPSPNPLIEPITCPPGCLPAQQFTSPDMAWFQKTFILPPQSRGSFLITDHVVKQLPEIKDYKVGLLHLFIQHTSCALSLNENWDSDVRDDMSDALDRLAPEDKKGNLYRHSAEGLDDMPVCAFSRCFLNPLT